MDLVEVKGKNAGVELDLASGKLLLLASVKDDAEMVKGSLALEADLVKVLELVKQKIPGSIDDAIIGVVQAALLAAKAVEPAPAPVV